MPAADFDPSHDHARPGDSPPSYRAAWLSVGLAFALAAGLWGWHLSHPDAPPQAAQPSTDFPWERAAPGPLVDRTASGAMRAAPADAPTLPGTLQVDANGHLMPTPALREWFDTELRRAGARLENLPSVRVQLLAAIQTRLPAVATQEALALFDRYVDYGRALQAQIRADQARGLDGGTSLDADMARLYAIESLRSHHFSPAESSALFGNDLLWDRYRIARQQTLNDHTIALLDEARRLKQLRAELPAGLREDPAAGSARQDLAALTAEWRRRQGSPAELRALREELLGAAGADQVEADGRRGQAWHQQLGTYSAQRQAVLRDPSLSDVQRQQALERLRQESLNVLEQLQTSPP